MHPTRRAVAAVGEEEGKGSARRQAGWSVLLGRPGSSANRCGQAPNEQKALMVPFKLGV